MTKKISRRHLLKGLLATAGALSLRRVAGEPAPAAQAQMDEFVYLPIIIKDSVPTPPPTAVPPTTTPPEGSRVVHVHDPDATSWDFSANWYGGSSYISQSVVDAMVNRGVQELTGTTSVTSAWQALIPGYQSGQVVAIKVNFNNSQSGCSGSGTVIDALPQPVRSIIAGLVAIGVGQSNIWIFDAIRPIPARFKSVITAVYPNVLFCDNSTCAGSTKKGWSNQYVTFSQAGLPAERLSNVVVSAAHLINVPILKGHTGCGVSFGFKNHFGTIDDPGGLHTTINTPYNTTTNPLVDIYRNANIGAKTRLTVGDGLFAAIGYADSPARWSTFGNDVPNSLFFSKDPVAIDCVMYDFRNAEQAVLVGSDNYLKIAHTAGLGTYERWSSRGVYSSIDYVPVEL